MAAAAPTKGGASKRTLAFRLKRAGRRLVGKCGYFMFDRVRNLTNRMSPERAERIGALLGRGWYWLPTRGRRYTLSNLRIAFPERSERERRELAKRVFEHFGIVAVDFARADRRTDEEVLETTEVTGIEHAHAAAKLGKGIVFVTGHFGNWERASQVVRAHGYPVAIVGRRVTDRQLQANVVNLREASGNIVFSRGRAVAGLLRVLREGKAIALLPDQNHRDAFIPFFGVPAGTALGPAVLAERTGAPMLPVFCVRVGVGRYKMSIGSPLQAPEGSKERPLALTEAFTRTIEEEIRRYPEQWLWLHDRWRSARIAGLATPK